MEEFLLRKLKREQEKRQAELENQPPEVTPNPLATTTTHSNESDSDDAAPTQGHPGCLSCPDSSQRDSGVAKSPLFMDRRHQQHLSNGNPEVNGSHGDDASLATGRKNERDVEEIELDFDEEQFLRELQEGSMGAYIYDSVGDNKRTTKRVRAVQTDF